MNGLILDVIIVVIAVLLLIFGAWRGMYKLIFGLVSSLAALVLAVVLASTVTSFVINKTNIDDRVYEALDERIQNVIPADLDASNVTVTFRTEEDADGNTVVIAHGADTFTTISEYLAGTTYSMAGNLLDSALSNKNTLAIINSSSEEDESTAVSVSTTLEKILITTAIVYILMAAVFVILWILCYIVVRLLMFLLKKVVHGTYIGHFVDKLLGLVIGGAFAIVLIWGALAVIRLLGTYTWIIPVNEVIESSTIGKILYENNFLYKILVQTTNLQEAIAGLIGKFGVTSVGDGEAEATEAVRSITKTVKPFVGRI